MILGSGNFDEPVQVFYKSDEPDAHQQRKDYEYANLDWAEVSFLETTKDNQTETSKSHDSSFAIARLTFRNEPRHVEHRTNNVYYLQGSFFELVGVPMYRRAEGLVLINVKTRDDLYDFSELLALIP